MLQNAQIHNHIINLDFLLSVANTYFVQGTFKKNKLYGKYRNTKTKLNFFQHYYLNYSEKNNQI